MSLEIAFRCVRPLQATDAARWRARFETHHCVHLPRLLHPEVLDWLRRQLASAPFTTRVHTDLTPPAVDLGLADKQLLRILFTLTNDRTLFEAVEAIAACDPIGCFRPTVYRMEPQAHHRDTWHGDDDGNRLVAMSVNVGSPYEGGVLQIRRKRSDSVLQEAPNTGPGDAILFRIRGDLEHCVTPVTGIRPKMALAGWFQRTPPALTMVKGPTS